MVEKEVSNFEFLDNEQKIFIFLLLKTRKYFVQMGNLFAAMYNIIALCNCTFLTNQCSFPLCMYTILMWPPLGP